MYKNCREELFWNLKLCLYLGEATIGGSIVFAFVLL